uniref:PiggyBac transposable element-derived protein domain-containing protein n=1 Tax=Maylandia zebra TaxID=106582 RepID=A0A3P9DG32_9CICH
MEEKRRKNYVCSAKEEFQEGTEVSCSTEAAPTPEGSRGRGRSQMTCPPAKRGKRSRSLSGDAAAWMSEKNPDSLPHPLLNFCPKRKPGVQLPFSESKNIAAGKKFTWTDLPEAELYHYIGITLYMGVLKLPKMRDFWRVNSIFHVQYPSEVMTRDRFLTITWNIHMSDPAEDTLNDRKKGTTDYDCLHRLRPLYDSLRVSYKAVYHPQQNLSVDERMVSTKARVVLKQYIKSKPTKWGIKLFVLSDNTGYTVDFNIYTGRSTLVTGKGLSFDAVMALINKNYLGTGYHIYCDNFYTSPALFHHPHDGFGACGTWIREGSLIFIKWMDTREVSVCSTLHSAFSGDTVKRMCKVEGQHRAIEVPVPSADQLIGSYSSWRKSRKWYVTVLHHFIDIAVTNSYLVSKELCGRLEQRPMTHQDFQEQLITELCGVSSQSGAKSYQHIPVAIVEGASGQNKATKGHRKCRLCGKCTPFKCEACKVALCVISHCPASPP